ncbi:MAG: hypothetical protein WBQ03_08260 [Candidatus Sulfotelmatobacter sp.]
MNRFNWGVLRFCQIQARGNGIVLREKILDGIYPDDEVQPRLLIRTKEAT